MAANQKRPPYLKIYDDRHGRERIYFRRKGYKETALAGPLFSDEFWKSYQKAMNGPRPAIGAGRNKPGSMNEVIVAYYKSADFKNLKPSTKSTYRGIIERFRKEHGEKAASRLQPRHIRQMMREIGYVELEWVDITEKVIEGNRIQLHSLLEAPDPIGHHILQKDVPRRTENTSAGEEQRVWRPGEFI